MDSFCIEGFLVLGLLAFACGNVRNLCTKILSLGCHQIAVLALLSAISVYLASSIRGQLGCEPWIFEIGYLLVLSLTPEISFQKKCSIFTLLAAVLAIEMSLILFLGEVNVSADEGIMFCAARPSVSQVAYRYASLLYYVVVCKIFSIALSRLQLIMLVCLIFTRLAGHCIIVFCNLNDWVIIPNTATAKVELILFHSLPSFVSDISVICGLAASELLSRRTNKN